MLRRPGVHSCQNDWHHSKPQGCRWCKKARENSGAISILLNTFLRRTIICFGQASLARVISTAWGSMGKLKKTELPGWTSMLHGILRFSAFRMSSRPAGIRACMALPPVRSRRTLALLPKGLHQNRFSMLMFHIPITILRVLLFALASLLPPSTNVSNLSETQFGERRCKRGCLQKQTSRDACASTLVVPPLTTFASQRTRARSSGNCGQPW